MNHSPFRGPALMLASTLILSGCSATPPSPNAESAVTSAIGLAEAVTFHTEGGPLNESGPPDKTLTLVDTVRRAATTDPGLQAALARVRIALADADQARLLPNPVLNIIFKFPESGGKPNIEAELTGDLVSILQIPSKASAADARLRAACADAVTTALDVVAEAQERYATVQAIAERMPVLEERRRLLEKLLRLAHDRLDAGEGTRSDVTTLDAQRVQLEVEVAENEQHQRDERLRLSRLIGQPSGEANWAVERWQPPSTISQSEPLWIDSALANRPEIQAITWELAALGDDLKLAQLSPFEDSGAGVKADRDDEWATGPSISTPIPVFDVGQARRDKVTARLIETRHKLVQAKRQVVEDVRRAYESFVAAQANLGRVRADLIPLQETRRSQAEDAYRAGQTDVAALLLAEQDLQTAFAKRVELEEAAAIALVRLERAVGGSAVAGRVRAAASPLPNAPQTTPLTKLN